MDRIIAPLFRNDRGPAVNNMQDGLILLLSVSPSASTDPDRQALISKLAAEQRAGVYGDLTTQAVSQFQSEQRTAFNLPLVTGEQVDDATAGAMNRLLQDIGLFERKPSTDFFITGRVEFEDGSPAAGMRVKAFDRDIGNLRKLLGDLELWVITAENGVFPAIRYHAGDFAEWEGGAGPNADLVFEVEGTDGQSAADIVALYRRFTSAGDRIERLVSDRVLSFPAGQVEEVRIVLAGRPSERGLAEYQRLMLALTPLLPDHVTPADFDQKRFRDIDFSARETGWSRALIETMTLAWQFARAASREPQLFAETFYGLLRHGAPTEVAALVATTLGELLNQPTRWAIKLADSLAHRIIDGDLEHHLEQLRKFRTDAAMQPGDVRRASTGDLLEHLGISEEERRTLLGAYHAHTGPIEEFWRDVVPTQMGWEAFKIQEVQTGLHLAEVLAYDLPLLKCVQDNTGTIAPRDLVRRDRDEWVNWVKQVGPSPDAPGDTQDEQIARTVDAITAVLDATYPTESVAHIANTSNDPQLTAARGLLAGFFERETVAGFDISSTPVTTYLETQGERVFAELEASDKDLLTGQLQRLQRVFRLGEGRAQTEALLTLGLDSAFHLTRFSPEHFVAEFGDRLGGPERAALAYGRAEKIAGTVLYIHTDLWQAVHAVKPAAIMASRPDPLPTLKELPAYRALFGSLDLCECGQCLSFYSPAAYFVDLLHMLDVSPAGGVKPVDVLFRRRPDLAHIQLTCENTNTLIPYVDLVTEVLESFVANQAPAVFNEPPSQPNRRLPSPSAEELRVNPVYLTEASATFADQAYAALQEAVFPLTLPLNLPLETTRAYLNHLGISRAELMALFDRDPGLEALMARAAEILLLSPEEFELITGATFDGASSHRPATTAEFFGLSTGGDPATLFNHAAPEWVMNGAKDSRAASIRSLQNILGILLPSPIPITGIYDAATEAAVNAILAKNGLGQNGRTDAAFWGALETGGMPSLSVMLCPVSMFLERSGLSYVELITLTKTRFVNPSLQGERDFDYLARLGIPDADVRAWIQAGLPAMPAPIQNALAKTTEDPDVFTAWVKRRTRAVVINTGFESPCDLNQATLMHLDGTLLSPEELLTLFRFVRLWRKLGWSIEDLDYVLEPGALGSAVVFNTVLLLANVKQLREQLGAPAADLAAFWQTIPTYGENSLYDSLFRNRAAQLIDTIVELNHERTELKAAEGATPPALSDHTGPILAAFRISAQDLAVLRAALKLEDDPDPTIPPTKRPLLNLSSLSAIYRHVTLARALRISIRELLTLIDLAGLSVFERADRLPSGDALAFVEIMRKLSKLSVKPAVLEYLCREVPQPPGLPGTQRDAWHRTLAGILDGLHSIAAEESIQDDPVGEELTARLTALMEPNDALAATALIYGRDIYTAALVNFPPAFAFPPEVSGKVFYDAARKQLGYRGAMTAAERALLLAAPDVPPAVQADYAKAVNALDAQPRRFVARAFAPLLSSAEAETSLIEASSRDTAGAPVAKEIAAKINLVLTRRRAVLSRRLIKQTLAIATGLPTDVVEKLLENDKVLKALNGTGPAIGDYLAIDGDGLDAEYFTNPGLTGLAALQRTDALVGFDLQGAPPAPGIPALGFSVRWTGNLYVPTTGAVAFHVRCSDGIRVTVNGTLVIDEWRDQLETEFNATLRLDGGQFYPIEVDYYNQTGGALLKLSWGSPAIPATSIPQSSLYTAARFAALLQPVERIYKLALLLAPFNLSAREIQLLAERGDLALDLMPVVGPAPLPVAQAMFGQWLTLYDFAALRNSYPSSEVGIIDVLNAASPEQACERFVTLTGVAADTLAGIVEAFTIPAFDAVAANWTKDAPDLTRLSWWVRIADALDLARRIGAAPRQLLAWAKAREIKQLPAGPQTLWWFWTAHDQDHNDRQADNARLALESKNLVRARYDEAHWRIEARALNDALRIRRRSALTAFMLAMPELMLARVSDTGRLFEYLLIDVEMDPCMETSRIKQGISSVQLFVQRILLNLESPEVPPTSVDRKRWEWIKNYRVWEANRKVFLYPESYLEADLRDDKTPIFKEMESELLQDELNEPNAERAFRHYLEKLDDVAKLTVCGTCIDGDAGVLHVFGRSSTLPFVFYHRWLDKKNNFQWTNGIWSPWQKLPVDVATIDDGDDSGAHLLPILWSRRLYLFWPLFEQKPDETQNAKLPEGFDKINCWHIKLAWSEYQDGRWSPKQTGIPFIVSNAAGELTNEIIPIHRVSFYTEHKNHRDGYWRHKTTGFWPVDLIDEVFNFENSEWIEPSDEPAPQAISVYEDRMLGGIILKNDDWAGHDQTSTVTISVSLLPKPSNHYLDAQIVDSQLLIRVNSRFKGMPEGQSRTVVEDSIAVARDGQRTDRKERLQFDCPVKGEETRVFNLIGTFRFPACKANLDGETKLQPLPFNGLERPQDTVNSFMSLREDWPRVSGLRLTNGDEPILNSVPTRFELIDSDNRSGFNRRGPFFYQDQQRCYLVTHDSHDHMFNDAEGLGAHLDGQTTITDRTGTLTSIAGRQTGIAPEASLRANPWAQGALVTWAAGPGLPAAQRDAAPPVMQTLAASFAVERQINPAMMGDHFGLNQLRAQPEYTFTPHWHPHACPFIAALNSGGLPALFALDTQYLSDGPHILGMPKRKSNFETHYQPDPSQVAEPWPLETVDFSRAGAYSQYNWEIFFHAPMRIATAHSRAGRYEDAMRWFHRVFDPMTGENYTGASRFWRFLPFRLAETMPIEETLNLLSYTGSDAAKLAEKSNLEASIQEWLDQPFNPHLIARRRPLAYMKNVFMKYLDNLIAWGDKLFLRDSIESINEATQLYILAANLLGPRQQRTPAPGSVAPETYATLRGRLDALSNAQVDLETRLPFTQLFAPGSGVVGQLTKLPQTLYFCLPQNDRLLAYWDTIADRLFKIRHCMSIDGTVRQLPLFEPPIDPMLLVEAVAHGLDIGSVLNDLYAPLPRYRFTFMLQQALAMCNEVRSLGSTLLSVFEKRDAESLSALRAGQETQLLAQVRASKKLQIDEAEQSSQALEETAGMVNARIDYYENLIAQGLISEETDQLGNLDQSNQQQEMAGWIEVEAQALNLMPNVSTGAGGGATFGGSNLGAAASAFAKHFSSLAAALSYRASRSSITGGHTRRAEEWRFQRDQAQREQRQVERQKAAAQIRKAIAEADLRNHDTQIEHAHAIEELLRTKFTNAGLYEWMEGQLRDVYFKCYQEANKIAKATQRCYQYQLGSDASFISNGAWDSSVRGLLAGEQLYLQLKQMESAYLERQIREFEITKHVSLLQLDPLALIALKESGICEVEIPEWLFDLDYPGHYFRRIKTVSITIPAIIGPYTSMSATVTLLSSKLRESARVVGVYGDDGNYRTDHLAVEAIAASTAQNDSGRFQLDFRDDKYLPFEGAGAISRWRIELPGKFRSFDYDTISDVVLHLKYTSRCDAMLAKPALEALEAEFKAAGEGNLFRFFSLRHEFPNEWHGLMTAGTHSATITIAKDRCFPPLVQSGAITVTELHSVLILKEPSPTVAYKATLKVPGPDAQIDFEWIGQLGRYRSDTKANALSLNIPIVADPKGSGWLLTLTAPVAATELNQIQDILIVARYSAVM